MLAAYAFMGANSGNLGVAALVGLIVYSLFLSNRSVVSIDRWLPMAAAGAVSLFEPLFVFGWLQLRFEKDWGVLPGILLAALGYALYHVGYMPGEMSGQFYSAVVALRQRRMAARSVP